MQNKKELFSFITMAIICIVCFSFIIFFVLSSIAINYGINLAIAFGILIFSGISGYITYVISRR